MPQTTAPLKTTALEDKALEEAYTQALTHEKAGRLDLAAQWYRRTLALDSQDHAGAAVRLAAIGHGEVPKNAPQAYVTTLFDQHADVFDMILVDQLHYNVPEQLRMLLNKISNNLSFHHMLDLGCGTGLAAQALDNMTKHKTGVDLAENMIAIAYEKELYDNLFVGDVVQFLAEEEENMQWDLITATDVLPYMGELEQFFCLAARHLTADGFFGFSSEKLEQDSSANLLYKVGSHQRFAHQKKYVESCLHQAGLVLIGFDDITVRQEQGTDVPGQLFLAAHI